MTGKQFRQKLKVLFKELNLDDKELDLSTISSVLVVGDINITKLYNEVDDRDERDRIWKTRTKYKFKITEDEQNVYVETVNYEKNKIAEA